MSCPECFKGAVHDHGTPRGTLETLHGLLCYVALPSAPSTPPSKSTILFLTDAFGLSLINNKLLADRYAAETGCKVVVPDIIPGGPASVKTLTLIDTIFTPVGWLDIVGQVSRIWAGLQTLWIFIPFMRRADVMKAYSAELDFARALRTSLPPDGKLGVAGFCWGGYGSTRLCTETNADGTPLINAQFTAHPSQLKAPEMIVAAVEAKVPYSLAIGDKDMVMNLTEVENTEAALRKAVGEPEENDYEVRIYSGCRHGFAARASPVNEVEFAGAEDAAKQAVVWFKRYLN